MPRLPSSTRASPASHHFPPATDASQSEPPSDDRQLKVLTLNVWGLNYISKVRIPRIKAIATHLASPSTQHYDFVCLQEIWYESKDWRFLKHALASRYPHAKFFYSGAFGSGLAILSRWNILETKTHPYSLNGQPIHVQHGDWFVGKACGSITINHPRLGLVDVWNTHFVAAGGEDGPEYKRSHRITQAYELASNCRNSAARGRHVVCVGDLNSTPPSIAIGLLRNVGGMYDSFLDSHPELPEQATSLDALDASPRTVGRSDGSQAHRPDPHRAIQELGVTCDSPLNTWTAGKKLDERASRGAGKRLDYILYRGPVPSTDSDPTPSLAYSASTSSRGRLACTSSSVVVTGIAPGLTCSFSDHFGVESIFGILDTSSSFSTSTNNLTPAEESSRKSAHHRVLTSSLHALAGGFAASRSTQMSHFYLFAAALLLAIGLIVGSIFQPLGGVNPVFVLLAVVAGWGGTTMLYSAVVWGEWEKRTLRTVMEMIELELNYIRPPSNANDPVREGTLF
ncbi:related to ISC1 - Inositol phosphoSphingolipid phospholipase [Ustilago trichophora]|uniref:Related to ISC1 - Inositol phosphoSphingolipid phospholipase n=1 Tax=Ustilago trichophora TaxID=86804 RepID=A0A5C3E0X0_9BASI|nr:related to ISC1 - Inositol phosphoSphingolipid phospholipase [Ustilago trichophora]